MTKTQRRPAEMQVCEVQCGTCPFRAGSKLAFITPDLAESALTEASRICHSTGNRSIGGRTGKPEKLCRGARDVQLTVFHSMGFLEAPTDEAWEKKLKELGMV